MKCIRRTSGPIDRRWRPLTDFQKWLSPLFYGNEVNRSMATRYNDCHQERLCAERRVAADTRSAVASSSWIKPLVAHCGKIKFNLQLARSQISQSTIHIVRERSNIQCSFRSHLWEFSRRFIPTYSRFFLVLHTVLVRNMRSHVAVESMKYQQ